MSKAFSIGFIGAGNMAGAIIHALLKSNLVPEDRIFIFDPNTAVTEPLAEAGVNTCASNTELLSKVDISILAVKPQIIDSVLSEISGHTCGKCIVSIAAGISTAHIKSFLGNETSVIRALPNTPMLVLKGMTVIAESNDVSDDVFEFVCSIFASAGEFVILPEDKINEAIPLSSSSPAFFFRMLNAMAHAGEALGIAYDDALKLSAVAMRGSAEIVLNGQRTPEELIRQVSSPGGTTVAALSAFDDFGFEAFTDEFVKRCVDRAYELGRAEDK